jgi:hypothetical protein
MSHLALQTYHVLHIILGQLMTGARRGGGHLHWYHEKALPNFDTKVEK